MDQQEIPEKSIQNLQEGSNFADYAFKQLILNIIYSVAGLNFWCFQEFLVKLMQGR